MEENQIKRSLPTAFINQMQSILDQQEWAAFLAALQAPSPVSIRLNPGKPLAQAPSPEPVPWAETGRYLPARQAFTLDPLFHAGCYYVQEASSMFISEAVRQLTAPGQPIRALDLCAAPGGKSTLLASLLPEGSLLLCNEVIQSRYHILQENLIKWGDPQTHTSNLDSRQFSGLAGFFDLILIDAPCSGEGLFRKDPNAVQEWSPNAVQHCAARQKRILADTIPLLGPGGLLLYSTCTYNREENEENSRWLQREFGLQEEKLALPESWQIVERASGYQLYPHRVRGEGLYLSCLRQKREGPAWQAPDKFKPDAHFAPLPKNLCPRLAEWLQNPDEYTFFQDGSGRVFALTHVQTDALRFLRQQLRKVSIGIHLGSFKREDFVPSPELALSTAVQQDLARWELPREQALRYLKKENIEMETFPEGWALTTCLGHPMGWVKGLRNRINNYYPKEWRIRMALE